jgi:hypothetical protein
MVPTHHRLQSSLAKAPIEEKDLVLDVPCSVANWVAHHDFECDEEEDPWPWDSEIGVIRFLG